MVIPMNKDEYIKKSKKELIIARQELMKNIIKLEKEEFLYEDSAEKPFKEKMMMHPSPEVIWKVKNEDWLMLTDLIENASEIERINVWMSEEQKALLTKLAPDYEHMDICDIEDVLSNELQTKGLTDDGVNEYGEKIENIIDIVVAG